MRPRTIMCQMAQTGLVFRLASPFLGMGIGLLGLLSRLLSHLLGLLSRLLKLLIGRLYSQDSLCGLRRQQTERPRLPGARSTQLIAVPRTLIVFHLA